MTNSVERLLEMASTDNSSVSELLSNTKIVAFQANATEILDWLQYEIDGYPADSSQIPDYRIVTGRIQYYNPYHGWCPIVFPDPELEQQLSKGLLMDSLVSLEQSFRNEPDGDFGMPLPKDVRASIMKQMYGGMEPLRKIPNEQIARIVACVKDRILNWALTLDTNGTAKQEHPKENPNAAEKAGHTFNIQNVENINQATNHAKIDARQSIRINNTSINLDDIADLRAQLSKLLDQLPAQISREIQTIDQAIGEELEQEVPDSSKLHGLLNSMKSVAEGATGNVVAQGLLSLITSM